MPPITRSKRVFAETSPDSRFEPASKRKSTGRASAKNNKAKSAKTALRTHANTITNKTAKAGLDALPNTWICICEDGVRHRCNLSPDCMCMRLADENRGHHWIMTKKGANLYREWRVDQRKRDAEAMDVLAYTDYSGYGTGEVVENMLCAFDTLMNSKRKNALVIWGHIEGMARFLSQDNWKWYHIDDSEANAKRVMLIGTAILTAIDHLINLGKFHDDGEIRNIGFIIGLLLQFALYFKEACCAYEDRWQVVVVKKADEHGVTIRSLNGIGLLLDKIRSKTVIIKSEEESANFEDNDPGKLNERPNFIRAYEPAPYSQAGVGRSWDSWDWKQELAAYTQSCGVDGKIGGNRYDLMQPGSVDLGDEVKIEF